MDNEPTTPAPHEGLEAVYFDGKKPIGQKVILKYIASSGLEMKHENGTISSFICEDFKIEPAVGKADRIIRFSGGACVHLKAGTEFKRLEKRLGKSSFMNLVHTLEKNLPVVVLSLVIFAGLIYSFIVYGLPIIAEHLAYKMHPDMRQKISEHGLKWLDIHMMQPSDLDEVRQQEIKEKFAGLHSRLQNITEYEIIFRHSKIGANAFALPSGQIILTDQLMSLADNDDQIIAVLFHELGHVEKQHGMRMVIQSVSVGLLSALFLSDMSSAAGIAVSLPAFLLETGYSRKFEDEADAYAVEQCLEVGISSEALVNILKKLGNKLDRYEKAVNWMSTHPATSERVRAIRKLASDLHRERSI
ncbi:MAG: M48 family metallopeptidase [Verrucomicrobiota bacterium]